ncbi:hypothetical protein G6F43_009887 [Rhizopus delemar]|nr:hypothetical protein G6F43_009887 [Rhizopus delemar]
MRHPDILRYLDGIETEQSIMFVTDPIEPLSNQLNQDPDKNLIIWGLYKVANAIKFLTSCDMVHGNVRISSIFTNKAGEWKLGGFELLCSMKEESPIILTFGGLVPDAQRYATPEVKKSGWTVIKELPEGVIDSYHLGCLIYEAYNHRFETTDSLLSQKGSIPQSMLRIYSHLLNPNVKMRASADMFLDEGLGPKGFFSNDFVKVNLFLENISIKEQDEKDVFFKKLDSYIESFPGQFCKYKILPELMKAFEYGSGGAKVLSAIIKVGDHLSDEEYESIVIEPVIRMFASPDRAIRVSLLENMPKFIGHMTNKMVTDQVFPNVATGFTDIVPLIREQTIKSVLLLVPKLNERIINYDLLKYLAKLQMDPEPGIRTNTTICLGKIAKHLSENTRKKVLISAFTRSLRDTFHHARVAALMALNATAEFYDAQECTAKIIPAISVVLIDKEKPVRDQAFKALNTFIRKAQDFAESMPETSIKADTSSPTSEEAVAQATSMANVLGGATKGLAGWAVSSIQSRFSTPNGEIGNPMQTASGTNTPTTNQVIPSASPIPPQTNASIRFDVQSIEPDVVEDTNGWDDEDSSPLDFGETANDTWDNQPETFSPSVVHHGVTSPMSFGSNPSSFSSGNKAQGSMKLGHSKPKAPATEGDGLDSMISTLRDTSSRTSSIDKDQKKNELERRREERRQRMAELREKKKASCMILPTKTVQSIHTTTLLSERPTHFVKRDDVQTNLELYQNWASVCRQYKNGALVAFTPDDTNRLWKTVTETINCGNSGPVTVTTTVSVNPTSTPSSSRNSTSCQDQCWSDYLWHTYGDGISPAQGFVGTLCMIIGLYFLILAFRFFRPTMALVGFIFFATMTWIGLVNNEPVGGYPLADIIYICVSAGLGLLGAFLFVFFYPAGIYCLAGLGGFYLAVYIMSWKEDLVIIIKVARICFIIGLGVLFFILLYFAETYTLFFCTAFIGSYLFFFGLDFFVHTGFINPWLLIFDGNPNHHNTYLMSTPVRVMLALVAAVLLFSVIWQFYWHVIRCPRQFGVTIVEVKEEKKEKKKEEKKEEDKKPPSPQPVMCLPPPYHPQPIFTQNIYAPLHSA